MYWCCKLCRRDAGPKPQRVMKNHGGPTAPRGDEGIVVADKRPYPAAEPPKTAATRIRSTSRQNAAKTRQNDQARLLHNSRLSEPALRWVTLFLGRPPRAS